MSDWTNYEVSLIVTEYFSMLNAELNAVPINKTISRNNLLKSLTQRSGASIEFKHRNISAILAQIGLPFIKGYKPLFNYQQLLQQEVEKYLLANFIYLQPAFEKFSDSTVSSKVYEKVDFTDLLDIEAPITEKIETIPNFRPVKINYLEKEQNNRSLGEKGEQVALDYERWRLTKAGKRNYAGKVEWISKNLGDGTGFDIYSKNIDGSDRFIEVKTTKLIKETPIFLTSNELAFSKLKTSNFYLYRFFNFTTKPQFFIQQGSYERYCELIPQAFKGYFH